IVPDQGYNSRADALRVVGGEDARRQLRGKRLGARMCRQGSNEHRQGPAKTQKVPPRDPESKLVRIAATAIEAATHRRRRDSVRRKSAGGNRCLTAAQSPLIAGSISSGWSTIGKIG